MPRVRPEFLVFSCCFALGLAACSPEIGDSCSTALDCSASGTRLCDNTQPAGYCTLEGCEADSCPEEAVCVQFGRRFEGQPVDRLSRTFCMYKCDGNGDCRNGDGYSCFTGKSFGTGNEAEVLGDTGQKFCAATPTQAAQDELEKARKADAGSK